MDPYEYTVDSNSIPGEEDLDEDQLEKLEQELAPQSSDYYGILNVSKTVRWRYYFETIYEKNKGT